MDKLHNERGVTGGHDMTAPEPNGTQLVRGMAIMAMAGAIE